MSKELVQDFLKKIVDQEDKQFLISTIAYGVAPTIAGAKPSSLMVFKRNQGKNLYICWEAYKEDIKKELKLDFYELKKDENIVSVLFFHKKHLEKTLKHEPSAKFLSRFGYKNFINLNESLKLLSSRYDKMCPHEIGVFLGYPIDDVVEFVDCPNKKCLMMGYWKVYHDIDKAKDTFKKYDEAKLKVINSVMEGLNPLQFNEINRLNMGEVII